MSATVEVHWLGHAATKLTSLTGKVIVIDPFLTPNPKTPPQYKNLDALGHVDVILLTHGHFDHIADVAELAKRTGAKVYGPAGLIATLLDLGWIPPEQGVRFGKGGKVTPVGPQIVITQTRAEHSDSGLFGDMRLIGEYYQSDLIMIPIGGHFVMDPRDAAYATREMLKPRYAIPFHYGTFPVLKGTPQEYQQALGQTSTQVFPISPGDKVTF